MASSPLASVSDLAAWVGQTIASDDPRAGAVLSAASALVRAHTGGTWATVEDPAPDAVSAIVVQVAARVWMNPAGLTSITVDDATRRWGESGSSGLYLTASEREILSPFVTTGNRTVGTLGTTRGDGYSETVYVPTAPEPSGPPFPWYAGDLP